MNESINQSINHAINVDEEFNI